MQQNEECCAAVAALQLQRRVLPRAVRVLKVRCGVCVHSLSASEPHADRTATQLAVAQFPRSALLWMLRARAMAAAPEDEQEQRRRAMDMLCRALRRVPLSSALWSEVCRVLCSTSPVCGPT